MAGNLGFVLDALTVPRAERSRRIDDALKLVRIDGFATRYPHQLSGGEQQRVALARALTHDREDAAVLADRIIEMRAGRIVSATENKRTEERG